MSDRRNGHTARRLFIQHGAERERKAIIADLRAEAGAYGGTLGEVLLAVATRIERGAK